MMWFLHNRSTYFNPLLGSIEGDAIGVFASASTDEAETFILKNQKSHKNVNGTYIITKINK